MNPSDFESRFRASRNAEMTVALYLLNRGHEVRLPKRKLRPHFTERKKFRDTGDIYASGKRIEVKHSKHDFQFQEWPFSDAVICAKKSFDESDPKPDFYYLVNASMTVAALIDVATTRPDWFVNRIPDRARGYDYEVYAVKPEYLAWRVLNWEEKL
jgi:hypothetical protein